MEQQSSKGRVIAIITMFFIFAMISFVTNMAAPFGNIWGYKYDWAGMMGNMMNFAAYLFMGIPAGKMLTTVGYKKTALIALGVGIVGLLVQYLSSLLGAETIVFSYDKVVDGVVSAVPVTLNLFIYLLGAFICGFCVCMLNTVVNPMLNILGGGGNKGNQLIQAGGALNSLSGTLTPFLVGVLIGTVTPHTTMGSVAPLLFIGMGIFVVAFIVISYVQIPEPALERARAARERGIQKLKYEHSAWSFRHFVFGALAIFFYVGVEIGIPGEMNFYISQEIFGANGLPIDGAAAVAGSFVAAYWLLMLAGRTISSAISAKVSTRAQLVTLSSLALVLLITGILLPSDITWTVSGVPVPLKFAFIAACGICTSVMWGGIFNLCVEGLGKYTEQASGIFMMLVVGGGVMPLIQDMVLRPAVGIVQSYWLIVLMVAYILWYGLIGCKNVNTDIPVEEENPLGPDVRDVI
ncbi:MAG: MFS transporter [Bacteroidales bacterium]|nr:MFS transporter [Bacteroidales bacterium]MCD8387719.1 MFS transporter [Bacteroidales bacterium]